MKHVILENSFPPGDVVMLTAALRDLHRSYPHKFITSVRTSHPELWDNNPYLTKLTKRRLNTQVLSCRYPLVARSNRVPYHLIHGFIHDLNEQLDINIVPTEFKGDIHLSEAEKSAPSPLANILQEDLPFWIISAGGKFDYTIKWWDIVRYQRVVDHFRGKIVFVQVGEKSHHHPPLAGVVDLRGKTDLRELIQLVYHSQGVLCPVTLLMHLAAAVETRPGMPKSRACVVVAGGREPSQWAAYPHHQFIHTNGVLKCCESGGCWRARTFPLGDGSPLDKPENLCLDVVMHKNGLREQLGSDWVTKKASPVEDARYLPHCMDLISAQEVIRRIELYFAGGNIPYLAPSPQPFMEIGRNGATRAPTNEAKTYAAPARSKTNGALATIGGQKASDDPTEIHQKRFLDCVAKKHHYPVRRFKGRGIVICGGGEKYFPGAWVCIHALRDLGCRLPIELWHLGAKEMTERMRGILAPLGVTCVDAEEVRKLHPVRSLGGWEMKPYAIMHSRFEEVLYLDADNLPVRDPEFLFETKPYRSSGAIFWPDIWRLARHHLIWSICDIDYRDEREFESGQIVVNKRRCWKALQVAMHLNEYSDFYYQHFLGDKETFHIAWMKLNRAYAMPARNAELKFGTLFQYDFNGKLLFQHRNGDKWRLKPRNQRIPGFLMEDECFGYLDALEILLDAASDKIRRWSPVNRSKEEIAIAEELARMKYTYHRVGLGHREMQFARNGKVISGNGHCEDYWDVYESDGCFCLEVSSAEEATFRLKKSLDGIWRGSWLAHEKTPVELIPQPEQLGMEPVTRVRRLPIKHRMDHGENGNPSQESRNQVLNQLRRFEDAFPRVIHIVDRAEAFAGEQAEALREIWLEKHPGWECVLWTDTDPFPSPIVSAEACDSSVDSGVRLCILRLEIAFSRGGLCVDAKRRPVRSLEPLLSMVSTDAFAGLIHPPPLFAKSVGNFVLGALPGSPFVHSALKAYAASLAHSRSSERIHSQPPAPPPSYLDSLTATVMKYPDVTIFPRHIFYPHEGEYSLAFVRSAVESTLSYPSASLVERPTFP
jgi:ADP-heptose:LPS heptosyltransferase